MKFFADTLGGTAIKFGPQNLDVARFPNVFIFFRQQNPTGGTKGTTVNHIGFSRAEPAADDRQDEGGRLPDDHADGSCRRRSRSRTISRHRQPEDLDCVRDGPRRDEGGAGREQAADVADQRCTTFTSSARRTTEMQAWYVKVFGAKPRNARQSSRPPTCRASPELLAVARRRSSARTAGRSITSGSR